MCVYIYLNLVFRWRALNRAARPCFYGRHTHTLNVNTSHGIFIPVILCHFLYHLLLAPGNLLQSCNLLCLLVFKGPFLHPAHCSTLSLSDFPPEGSSWRRHPSDGARQEPGPEGRSSKSLHWRRAVFSAAWTLHRLSGVSIIIIYWLFRSLQICVFE